MVRLGWLALLFGALGVVALTLGADSAPADEPSEVAESANSAAPRTVVVELFTSQGCSSCPPADRLLSELRSSGEAAGVEVVPLSFHVDYWNYIGWTDPFSSARWSERQRRYAEALNLDTIYTPQTVFDGHLECVGSSRRKVSALLAEAASQDEFAVGLRLVRGEGRAEARVDVAPVAPTGLAARSLDVYLAIWEDGLATPVGRGENARKTLHNDAVVRRFERLGSIDGLNAETEAVEWKRPLDLDPDWHETNLGIAIIVQDPKTLQIHGSAAVRVSDATPAG